MEIISNKNVLAERYKLKENIFVSAENSVFYILNKLFNPEILDNKNRKKLLIKSKDLRVFPHQRLADFIECSGANFSKIATMHVDFLICEFFWNIEYNSDKTIKKKNAIYKPLCAIEVNGNSHILDNNTKINDDFKKQLFLAIDFHCLVIQNNEKMLEQKLRQAIEDII